MYLTIFNESYFAREKLTRVWQEGLQFPPEFSWAGLIRFSTNKVAAQSLSLREVTLFLCLLKAAQFSAERFLRKALYSRLWREISSLISGVIQGNSSPRTRILLTGARESSTSLNRAF